MHLIKLAVGIRDVEHLAGVQSTRRFSDPNIHAGHPLVSSHTKRRPRQSEAVMAGGSLYWVIKGQIRCRQRVLGFAEARDEEGEEVCRILLDPELVVTVPQARKPFQGWRYLNPAEAPADLACAAKGIADMPPEMVAELRALGLL